MYVHVHVDCVYTVLYMSPGPETFLGWYPIAVGGSHVGRVKIRTKFPGLAIWYPVPE